MLYLMCAWAVAMVVVLHAGRAAFADEPGPSTAGPVRYSDFGARGDGKTDDIDAIIRTHVYANERALPVRADDNATYYIGGQDKTAIIQTDTDFGSAKFLIDDTQVADRTAHVFEVRPAREPIKLKGVTSLKMGQERIDLKLPHRSVVVATDKDTKRYIRFGLNQNSGAAQTDVFLLDQNGRIDPATPILWDFAQISELTAYPVDDQTLTLKGGHFTTIANQAESKYTYHSRGIAIRRSNVVVDGITHLVTGEGEQGAPYNGFIAVSNAADVTIQNAIVTGRKTYRTIGAAGKPVSMGSYDLTVNRALNVRFINVKQSNDIDDATYWGTMASNYCKNLVYDGCVLSRFDAHQGVFNATIRNSTLGHMGVLLIGRGTFTLENSTIRAGQLVGLRGDYGSTWEGEFVIRNCKFIPAAGRRVSPNLISGSNHGQHDFGYVCHMPQRITIENLHIDDANHPADYAGPAIFANFNPKLVDASYEQKFPYVITREVLLKNVTTASGKPLRVSSNPYMFKDVVIQRD